MKVPVSFIINSAFKYMDAKQNQTFRLILEMISTNKEEIDISVAVLSFMCKNSEMYNFASDLLIEYGTKQDIEEFLNSHEIFMNRDCPNVLQELKLHLFVEDKLGV